jgi:hypothetical protein
LPGAALAETGFRVAADGVPTCGYTEERKQNPDMPLTRDLYVSMLIDSPRARGKTLYAVDETPSQEHRGAKGLPGGQGLG